MFLNPNQLNLSGCNRGAAHPETSTDAYVQSTSATAALSEEEAWSTFKPRVNLLPPSMTLNAVVNSDLYNCKCKSFSKLIRFILEPAGCEGDVKRCVHVHVVWMFDADFLSLLPAASSPPAVY